MNHRNLIVFGFIVLLVLSILPLWRDPYYHRKKVDFWTWLKRELIELQQGERQ